MASAIITPRYCQALQWAAELHRDQRRDGKTVPYLSHLMAVSSLVWEDGGDEDQAIAGLLHDAIEDGGQSHGTISARFGRTVADLVQDCTDPGKNQTRNTADWLHWKRLYVESLSHKPQASLLVTAADKAHNAWDHVLDSHRDPACNRWGWADLGASAWYFQRLEEALKPRLPASRSVERLARAVEEILALPALLCSLPQGSDPKEWARAYEEQWFLGGSSADHRSGPWPG